MANRPSTITWLHLSDTHFGNPEYGIDSLNRFEKLFDDLIELRLVHSLKPDFIFFTGDLIFGNHHSAIPMEHQFVQFNNFIEKIRNIYSPAIKKENIFFAPGNHEVNRESVSEDHTLWLHTVKDEEAINKLISV